MVTASTVGYGDQFIATQQGRVFACIHMLSSVVLLGELIGTANELAMARADTLKRIAQLERNLDETMLLSLLNHAINLRPLVEVSAHTHPSRKHALASLPRCRTLRPTPHRPIAPLFLTSYRSATARV